MIGLTKITKDGIFMNRKSKIYFFIGIGNLVAFLVWTLLLGVVDVCPIGPGGSQVGFAALNGFFHELTGANFTLYVITDWLGLVPIFVALCFAIVGLVQWIKRKSILKVDYDILALGVFYTFVIGVYVLFEFVVINRRPVLIDGYLEASYPSSTTVLVMCVMITALIQVNARVSGKIKRRILQATLIAFISFMVIGRLISGVHWLSDIVGGVLVSVGLVCLYKFSLYMRS